MDYKTSVETTADNVEDAIAKGLAELGVGPSEVLVEVLEEPSRGVFGIGARPAKVRLQLISGRRAAPAPPTPAPSPPAAPAAPSRKPADESYLDDAGDEEDDFVFSDEEPAEDEFAPDEDAAVGKAVLSELLHYMGVKAAIRIRRAAPTRDEETALWLLDVTGKNLSSLIGRKGETLAALQYVTRLIASRQLQRRANLIIDVDGYKSKRSGMLRKLAERMAEQAIKQKRVVTLEPMPPNERRIIHLTLRDREDVTTRSVGEGDARKVTIVPR